MSPPPPAPTPGSSLRRETWLALGLPALLLLALIVPAGIWDPYELNVADLARRAALQLLGGASLELPGAENRLPTLGDVGRDELPVMSIAVALRVLGLGGASGRLPMALWGFAGVLALWLWLRRLVSARAGTYATLVLVTMPLYFVHARTMLGDVVTMAAQLMACAGLSVALLDPEPPPRGRWLLLGALGLLAGFFSRGALLGVAVPCLAVGLAWLLTRRDGSPSSLPSDLGGGAALLAGLVAVAFTADALAHATPLRFYRALGAAVQAGQRYPTFDAVASQLGHALFPWSAFLPLALGRLLAPPRVAGDLARRRESRLRAVLVLGVALAYGSHGWIAPRTGVLPFAAVGLLAALAALVLLDFERGAPPSRALLVGSSALAGLLAVDLVRIPEKAMVVFALPYAPFPDSFRPDGARAVVAATLVFVVLLTLALLDTHEPYRPDPTLPALRRLTAWDEVATILRHAQELWQGNLAFVAVMLEAMLVGVGALLWLSERLRWRLALGGLLTSDLRGALMNAWWQLPLALLAGLFLALTARRLFRLMLARTGLPRAWVAAAAGVGAGLLMSLWYYPALAEQLSPRQAFASYRALRGPADRLGLLGVAGRSVAYYTGGEAQVFVDPATAFHWLMEGPERRWLAVRADDLPRLNSLYRAHARTADAASLTPDHNLPVLDAHSSQIVLVSSSLAPGQASQNPLTGTVLTLPPAPQHPLHANLDDSLEALGWDLLDADSAQPAPSVVPGHRYQLQLYWRVLAPLTTQWKGFIHIDGSGRRHNGDHDLLGGRYPMSLWQPGDVVVDRYELRLEPNFTPGAYSLYYGLFLGDRRMTVKEGKHHDNRLEGGALVVR